MKKTIEQVKKTYDDTLKTGMFFEFFPNMTGIWEKDKKHFIKKTQEYWDWEIDEKSN